MYLERWNDNLIDFTSNFLQPFIYCGYSSYHLELFFPILTRGARLDVKQLIISIMENIKSS